MYQANLLRNEEQRKIIESIKAVVPGRFYEIDYTADYYLNKAIECSPATLEEFNIFAAKYLLNIPATESSLQSVGAGCSVFAGKTMEGEGLLCRNYDYSHELTAAILKCHPKDGYKSMGMCDLAFLGMMAGSFEEENADLSGLMLAPYIMVDGVNEKGVAIATLELAYPGIYPESNKPRLSTSLVPRLVLDRAATTQEAIELLSQYYVVSPMPEYEFHFMITDSLGVSKVIEFVHGEMKVYDAKYVANEYLTPYMYNGVEMPRYNMMREYVRHRKGRFSVDEAFSVLRSVHSDKRIGVGDSITRWSAVMNLSKKAIDLYYDRDFDNRYHFQL